MSRLGDDDGEVVGNVGGSTIFDTRGDGFAEDVGFGDTGTTLGLAVAVAVGFVREWVGVGVGDVVVPMTVIVPCMLGWTLQWYANVPGLLKVQAKLLPGSMYPESNECPSSDVTVCIGG